MALISTDPIDLLLDSEGDLVIQDGKLQFSSGLPGVAQGIRIRLLTFRGEWFLNRDHGVPYLANDVVPETEALLGGRFNEVRARAGARDAILSAPGVVDIPALAVAFSRGTRRLDVTWKARTEFGDTEGEETI